MRLLLALALATLLLACERSRAPAPRVVTIFAAASLSTPLTDLARQFESEHPNVRARLNLAGSQTLASQLLDGARADIFLSADRAQMDRLAERSLVHEPRPFATNRLVLAVNIATSPSITTIDQITAHAARVVLAAPEVPIGAYTRAALDRLGLRDAIERSAVSLELDAKAVLGKLLAGEADAGFVYATDITRNLTSQLRIIELPPHAQVQAEYVAAQLRDAPQPDAAAAFLRLLSSPQGAETLKRYNFQPR